MIVLEVEVEAEGWRTVPDIERLAQQAAEAAIACAPRPLDDAVAATLLLTGDAEIAELNRLWRGQNKPTNVLSFPASFRGRPGERRPIGDIALAYETVARESDAEGKAFADHASHLVVHGILHLLGEDHTTDLQADAMERIEVAALAKLGISDPYRDLSA